MAKVLPIREALTYDDVLLVPQYSSILPADANLSTKLGHLSFELPLVSAPMDTVTEATMAIAVAKAGGLGIIHKNMSAAAQAGQVKKVSGKGYNVGGAVSVGDEQFDRALQLVSAGATVLVVDSAHGHSAGVINQVKRLKNKFKKSVVIIGGNVATAAGTRALIQAGADVVKVGIGPGSICTTRIVAGIGVPQLTAIMDSVAEAKKTKTAIIADGGIKYSGDIVKALAAGSAAIMAGGLFAGTDEAPGDVVTVDGVKMKTYRGMGSEAAMMQGSKDRYGQKGTTDKKKLVPEGVVGYKPYNGKVTDVIYQLAGGIRSGMGYNGAKDIATLQKVAEFVRISNAGLAESHPHTLAAMQQSINYQSKK
ncbi:MAG: guanosine monophosphate reductase [Candidatus Kerfeldbacteria bacterium CG15_BIG_FIL_POST_REV_8_21_14_020_45_12]|uniref:Guanosine monophosphate reductase n=1 Tax=Candidatus Kerfeldbacteria bacterium CG15_BIG_FIL_POST_REV_8_21_14_020_45_12 TaxID=2014247 RepID=A0A2M7H398_9BACT|nr:MAG: guanosine monophosphate reductase [Candidatus Kerfeldbacteria bacterium CG15_BIG_FIL_POST_REV_8_21_14_020_45_12]PJA93553.1 MAG: guanosine monophosphate reductase [Candidatus Kerfeldbacteria bacterium CG_4_9_14_3_um_filter_45_8]